MSPHGHSAENVEIGRNFEDTEIRAAFKKIR
jgi:hypothetical protein